MLQSPSCLQATRFSSLCLEGGALCFFLHEAANLQRQFLASCVPQDAQGTFFHGFEGPEEMEMVRHQFSSLDPMYCKRRREEIEALQDMRTNMSLANPCCTSAVESLPCTAVTKGQKQARDPSLKSGVREQHGTVRDDMFSHLPFVGKLFKAQMEEPSSTVPERVMVKYMLQNPSVLLALQ